MINWLKNRQMINKMRIKMIKKAFTIIEIMTLIVMLGILVTLGIPAYQNFIEDAKAKVCEKNLKALKTALDIYIMEHDTMPANLGLIPQEYIDKGYARVLKQRDTWRIKLAYFILERETKGLAYAAMPFIKNLAKGNTGLLVCPKDFSVVPETLGSKPGSGSMPGPMPMLPPAEKISYGMNSISVNMSCEDYESLAANTLLIGDCAQATFSGPSGLAKRHRHAKFMNAQDYALAISKTGEIWEVNNSGQFPKLSP